MISTMKKRNKDSRKRFFDKQVHMKVWKDSMAGENENTVIEILNMWGYDIELDYKRQYPIGDRYVADFAFPYERVVIEVDGKNHHSKTGRKKDRMRDRFMRWNEWVVIRIDEAKLKKNPIFYKHLVHEVIEERRKTLFKIEDCLYEIE